MTLKEKLTEIGSRPLTLANSKALYDFANELVGMVTLRDAALEASDKGVEKFKAERDAARAQLTAARIELVNMRYRSWTSSYKAPTFSYELETPDYANNPPIRKGDTITVKMPERDWTPQPPLFKTTIHRLKFSRDCFALVWPPLGKPAPAKPPANYEPMSHEGMPASKRSLRKRRRSEFGPFTPDADLDRAKRHREEIARALPWFSLEHPLR